MQLFASAWGVGLVGADRSKLEKKIMYNSMSGVFCACNLGIDREAFKLFEIYTNFGH